MLPPSADGANNVRSKVQKQRRRAIRPRSNVVPMKCIPVHAHQGASLGAFHMISAVEAELCLASAPPGKLVAKRPLQKRVRGKAAAGIDVRRFCLTTQGNSSAARSNGTSPFGPHYIVCGPPLPLRKAKITPARPSF